MIGAAGHRALRLTAKLPDGWVAHDLNQEIAQPDPAAAVVQRRQSQRMREAGVQLWASWSVGDDAPLATLTVALRRVGDDAPDTTMLRAAMSLGGPATTRSDGPDPVDLPLGKGVRTTSDLRLAGAAAASDHATALRDRVACVVDDLLLVADFVTSDLDRRERWLEAFWAITETLELRPVADTPEVTR